MPLNTCSAYIPFCRSIELCSELFHFFIYSGRCASTVLYCTLCLNIAITAFVEAACSDWEGRGKMGTGRYWWRWCWLALGIEVCLSLVMVLWLCSELWWSLFMGLLFILIYCRFAGILFVSVIPFWNWRKVKYQSNPVNCHFESIGLFMFAGQSKRQYYCFWDWF